MKRLDYLLSVLLFVSACAPVPPVSITPSPADLHPTATASPDVTASVFVVPSEPTRLEPFGTVLLEESGIEFDVEGDGQNVDSIAFWEAVAPEESLMFVTSKGNSSIEVYQYPFESQLTTIACGDESNGVWVDQQRSVLYITERGSSNVCAYNLPGLEANSALRFTTAATGGDSEPNLAMLKRTDGQSRIYVSYDDIVYYHDAETGESLGEFTPAEGLETIYGDDYYQVLYIPDEGGRTGVYQYDPDGNAAGPTFGDRSVFDSDAEGIWVYRCRTDEEPDNGEGLIIVSDQKEELTDFEVFNRRTKQHLGTINIPGVNNTDGIAVMHQSSPRYPRGLLAVIDDDTSAVGVGWQTLFEKTGLSCSG